MARFEDAMMVTLEIERARVASLLEALDWALEIGNKQQRAQKAREDAAARQREPSADEAGEPPPPAVSAEATGVARRAPVVRPPSAPYKIGASSSLMRDRAPPDVPPLRAHAMVVVKWAEENGLQGALDLDRINATRRVMGLPPFELSAG